MRIQEEKEKTNELKANVIASLTLGFCGQFELLKCAVIGTFVGDFETSVQLRVLTRFPGEEDEIHAKS